MIDVLTISWIYVW